MLCVADKTSVMFLILLH